MFGGFFSLKICLLIFLVLSDIMVLVANGGQKHFLIRKPGRAKVKNVQFNP